MNPPPDPASQWGGKRYHSFHPALKKTFSTRAYKVGVRMDFTCPNRDGLVAVGRCIYCNNAGHTPENFRVSASVTEQLAQGTKALRRRHRAEKFIAYFQSYTNTYGAATKLDRLYREALDFLERLAPEIVIDRLTGETYRALTVAPEWSINKFGVHNAIHDELERRDTWQGKFFLGSARAHAQAVLSGTEV
jgi:radical SAM superfamily enzyme